MKISLPFPEFKTEIKRAIRCSSRLLGSPYNNILIDTDGSIISTDGFTMYVGKIPIEIPEKMLFSGSALRRLIKTIDWSFPVFWDPSTGEWENDGYKWTINPISGDFPGNWREFVIPAPGGSNGLNFSAASLKKIGRIIGKNSPIGESVKITFGKSYKDPVWFKFESGGTLVVMPEREDIC